MPFLQTPLIERTFDIRSQDFNYESKLYTEIYSSAMNQRTIINWKLSDIRNNEIYIQLLSKMKSEMIDSIEFYDSSKEIQILENKFSQILPEIFRLNPDRINAELTYNRSIIFTILVQNTIYYIESYFDARDFYDEGIFSTFDKNKGVKSYAGSMKQVIEQLSREININSFQTGEFWVNV